MPTTRSARAGVVQAGQNGRGRRQCAPGWECCRGEKAGKQGDGKHKRDGGQMHGVGLRHRTSSLAFVNVPATLPIVGLRKGRRAGVGHCQPLSGASWPNVAAAGTTCWTPAWLPGRRCVARDSTQGPSAARRVAASTRNSRRAASWCHAARGRAGFCGAATLPVRPHVAWLHTWLGSNTCCPPPHARHAGPAT